jgi:hypothetical protein
VTTSRIGITSAGRSDTLTCSASRRERPKKRGSTSSLFSGVSTFVHRREAELTRSHRGLDLGESRDELGRGEPVVGGPRGELQIPAEVGERGAVAELAPALLLVEVGEGEEEIGEGTALVAEHGSHLVGQFTCSGHTRSVARDFRPSPNAPRLLLTRKSDGGVATPHAHCADPHANRRRCEKHGSVSFGPRKAKWAICVSMVHCGQLGSASGEPVRWSPPSPFVTRAAVRLCADALLPRGSPARAPRLSISPLATPSRRTDSGRRTRSAARRSSRASSATPTLRERVPSRIRHSPPAQPPSAARRRARSPRPA